jgi:hypothetical protein
MCDCPSAAGAVSGSFGLLDHARRGRGTWTSHINGSASFSKEVLLDGASVTTCMANFADTSVSAESL